MSEEPYDVIRWTTSLGRRCAAMVPPGFELADSMREQLSALADDKPVGDEENPEFHFTVTPPKS